MLIFSGYFNFIVYSVNFLISVFGSMTRYVYLILKIYASREVQYGPNPHTRLWG